MKVSINLTKWALEEISKEKRLTGTFEIKTGATVVATQSFNGQYNNTKIPFSMQLLADIEAMTERVKEEITKNFVGEEE